MSFKIKGWSKEERQQIARCLKVFVNSLTVDEWEKHNINSVEEFVYVLNQEYRQNQQELHSRQYHRLVCERNYVTIIVHNNRIYVEVCGMNELIYWRRN